MINIYPNLNNFEMIYLSLVTTLNQNKNAT